MIGGLGKLSLSEARRTFQAIAESVADDPVLGDMMATQFVEENLSSAYFGLLWMDKANYCGVKMDESLSGFENELDDLDAEFDSERSKDRGAGSYDHFDGNATSTLLSRRSSFRTNPNSGRFRKAAFRRPGLGPLALQNQPI